MAVPAFACAPCACCPAVVFLSFMFFVIKAVIAPGFHLFPFRTEQLSPCAPMVLHTRGRVGRRRFSYISILPPRGPFQDMRGGFFLCLLGPPRPGIRHLRPVCPFSPPCGLTFPVPSFPVFSFPCVFPELLLPREWNRIVSKMKFI